MSKYFKTSDGEEFYTENHAYNHARSLDDKTVTPPSIVVEEEDEATEKPVVKLSKMNKQQLIDFAESNEIEVDKTATNAVIIEAIEAAQAKEIEAVNLAVVSTVADEIGTKNVIIENTQE